MWVAGELGAFDPLKEERRDDDRSKGGGGNMVIDGVLGTEWVGVNKAPCCEPDGKLSSFCRSRALTDSVSLVIDSRRRRLGRLGVRL